MQTQEPSAHQLKRALSLAQAAQRVRGRGGKPASYKSILRWINPDIGYRSREAPGRAVVLQTFRLGSEVLTLPEWIDQFETERLTLGLRRTSDADEPARRPDQPQRGRPAPSGAPDDGLRMDSPGALARLAETGSPLAGAPG